MTTKLAFNQLNGNIVNVADYGAVGDGVTDDTAAIQAAVNAAANRRLFVPAGTYLHGPITISSPVWIDGEGRDVTTFSAISSIGQNNMFYANGVDGITVGNCGFNMNNSTISSIQTDSYLENIFCFVSCSNVTIEKNLFKEAMQHCIIFNGASGNENENIYIRDNRFEDGIKGGVIMVRYNRNVHVTGNDMYNVCDDSKVVYPAASTGYKSIGVDGVIGAYIKDNDILQDNGSVSGTIIVEYQDRQSENVHVKGNTVNGGSNGIKIGPSVGVKVLDNNCLNSGDMGIYSEGAYEIEIAHNYVENADQNAVRIFEDAQTGRLNRNVKVHHNTFKNSNIGGATLGNSSTGAVGSDQSYHVACRQASDIYIKDNIFIDDGASTAGGVYMAADDYYIEDNNFLQMKAGTTVTIYNTAPATGTHRIANNAGARTEAKGIATIASGTSSITVTPDVVSEVTNAIITTSLNEALSGSVAYIFAGISGTGQFDIYCRDSSHITANVSTDTDVTWTYSVTDAIGTFGLTTE